MVGCRLTSSPWVAPVCRKVVSRYCGLNRVFLRSSSFVNAISRPIFFSLHVSRKSFYHPFFQRLFQQVFRDARSRCLPRGPGLRAFSIFVTVRLRGWPASFCLLLLISVYAAVPKFPDRTTGENNWTLSVSMEVFAFLPFDTQSFGFPGRTVVY